MKLTESEIIEKKNEIQEKVVLQSSKFDFLVLAFATSVGKSLSSIKVINHHHGKWVIVIDRLIYIKNFKEEFIKHGYEHLLEDVVFSTYRSLHKHLKEPINVILDECHHITIASANKMITSKNVMRVVALSATVKPQKEELLMQIANSYNMNYRKISLDLNAAISIGIVPEPRVVVVEIPVNDDDFIKYKLLKKEAKILKGKYFGTGNIGIKNKWLNKALQVKNFVASIKVDYAKKISDSKVFQNKRRIVFTNSIKQADYFGGELSIHSEKKNNDEIISNFNKGVTDSIYCVRMAREALNLILIELGLVIQLDNQELSTTQILGRVLRAFDPVIYVLEAELDLDRKYVENNLYKVAGNYIKRIDYKTLIHQLNNPDENID